jgi:hypothetical protein
MAQDLRVTVQVTGGDELFKALEELEPAAAKRVVSGPFNKYGNKIKQLAESLAPEDTGAMASRIKKRKLRTPNGLYAMSVGLNKSSFANYFYAAPVDLGYTQDSGRGGVAVEPNPFMEAAFDFYLDTMKVEIPNELWAGVLKRWSKAGIT